MAGDGFLNDAQLIPNGMDESGARAWAHIMYALHAISAASGILTSATIAGAFVFGWPSIIAMIINYLTRAQVRGSYLEGHWSWQRATFWYALLWLVIAGLLILTILGIPFAFLVLLVTGLWVLYRVVRGWWALFGRRSIGR